jgi:XXXCH domain-containing protein
MGKDKITPQVMTAKEAADFLRTVADKLEKVEPGGTDPSAADLGNLRKLRISLKRDSEFGQISVKMKTRYFDEWRKEEGEIVPEVEAERKPSFKELKKRMKGSFKEIFKSLANGTFPSEEAVESFARDAELMITFPKRGEEHYEEFKKACAQFREAFQKRDLAECQTKSNELNRMKTECHSDHK